MNGLFVVSICGVPTVIRETVKPRFRQAEWEIIREATSDDIRDIPPHHYFTQGMVPA